MYTGVTAYLDKNSSLFADNEEFINHRNSFKSISEQIGLKDDERNKATTGKTKDKEEAKISVIKQALAVAGALHAFAKKAGAVTLQETTRYSKSKLDNLRDNVLVIELNSIKDKAIQNSDAITKFGISAEKLAAFEDNISQYANALGAKASGGALKTGAIRSLNMLFKDADSLLDSIDRLMENFIDSNVQFYSGYKAARVIKNLGIRHDEVEAPVVAAVNNEQ